MNTEKMRQALNDWWTKRTSDQDFYATMAQLILEQAEINRQTALKTMEIGAKLEVLIQRINHGKRNDGGSDPLPH